MKSDLARINNLSEALRINLNREARRAHLPWRPRGALLLDRTTPNKGAARFPLDEYNAFSAHELGGATDTLVLVVSIASAGRIEWFQRPRAPRPYKYSGFTVQEPQDVTHTVATVAAAQRRRKRNVPGKASERRVLF